MVRLFRHPVNAADLPDRHGSAEIPFTVKARIHSPHQSPAGIIRLSGRRNPRKSPHESVRIAGNVCSGAVCDIRWAST